MKLPEEEADHELRKLLRAKLDGYQAPVRDEVRVNVFAALGRSSDRYYWILALGLLLILGGIFAVEKMGSRKRPVAVIKKSAVQEHRIQSSPATIQMDPAKEQVTEMKIAERQPHLQQLHAKADQIVVTQTYPAVAVTSLTPIDSITFSINLKNPAIALIPEKSDAKKPGLLHDVKGIFSVSGLQTFQLVNLSQSPSERVQNFRFAPLLSSKSLSYRITAGLAKKNTQLLMSYTYLRNWTEFEVGTNQLVATRVGENQYQVYRIGEKHVMDDRAHLLGIGLRQSIPMPPHILRNYALNLGVDYTRIIPKGEDLVWGNASFTRRFYQTEKLLFDIGPYFQYSFIERKAEGQTWKSRPYQVGISLGVKWK